MSDGLLARVRATIRAHTPTLRAQAAAETSPPLPVEHLEFARGSLVPEEVLPALVDEVKHYTPVPRTYLPNGIVPGTPEFYAAVDSDAGCYEEVRQIREKLKRERQ